jgi:putative oxidoreductase
MSSIPASLPTRAAALLGTAVGHIDRLQPLFAFALRLYVAYVFLISGLTKIRDWDITLALFENEYHVPVLSPALAALLGTSAELALPILLAAGLGTRFAALGLFVFNIVAVVSYPDLSDAGLKDHVLWGALLLVTFFHGPGTWSLDRWFQRRLGRRIPPAAAAMR